MRRALRLAMLGRHASPNPMVGCVMVSKDGAVLGEGFHHRPGEPHAEIMAMSAAPPEALAGATAYVTLEPCAHSGRTPPCADALIQAGVAKVIVAMPDPDGRVNGAGIAKLRAAGIEVRLGMLEGEARRLNAAFVKHRSTGIPWVTMKSAMTLDGKIATASGESRWISSTVSRAAVHRLRDRCDAVLCGIGTVLADDCRLTARLPRAARNPWRVVVDSRGRTPPGAAIVEQSRHDGRTIIATTAQAAEPALRRLEDANCRIAICDARAGERVSLPDLMARLGGAGDIISILAEPGPALAASLLHENLVDRWVIHMAPRIVGGAAAPGPVGGEGVADMGSALPSGPLRAGRCGEDLRIEALFSTDYVQ